MGGGERYRYIDIILAEFTEIINFLHHFNLEVDTSFVSARANLTNNHFY